ncbi:Na+/H+ antiporter NhaC [Staphylococcus arlettae]|uniref:Na+/H+ antiporter n=1 Tax=Staphylococcus arlettae TaxID=29378 RepID=A0A380CVW7_9STAP|nr:Na+/H+ antiporter NhaC [Staphylococcus arlettae]PNZ52953.1 Na+/H+ antiporter NhaC [Staphylococcus arlettae]GEP99366.1 Na+/H+ antiporter NhaC [Staphylococcus arlettae]SUJ30161.1 Na+/H+ antiporter [Staphylococcus arlettae]
MDNNYRLPTGKEIIFILIAFIVTMFVIVIYLGLPIQIALLLIWFIIIIVGLKIGYSYNQLQSGLCKGIYEGMEAILVMISIGALIGTWIASGIVPSIIYAGLHIISPTFFLVTAFIICIITSLATGTSFGSAGTAGIAMIGIGTSFGLPLPLVAGAVISGCYVGDKMSPLSDTTVMTASLSRVDLFDHIKSMSFVSIPSVIITLILFGIANFTVNSKEGSLAQAEKAMGQLSDQFNISGWMAVPLIIVIILLALKVPSVPVILFGSLMGAFWAFWFQGIPFVESIKILYRGNDISSGISFIDNLLNRGGITFMLETVLLVIIALGIGGLMEVIGVTQKISNIFSDWAYNSGRLTLTTLLAGIFGNFFGGAAYVSLLTATKMTEKNYDKLKIKRTVLSRNSEAGGTVTTPMIPWSDGGVFMATTLGISTMHYLPFLWYSFVVLIISIIFGFKGRFIWKTDSYYSEKESYKNLKIETKDADKNIIN